MPVGYATVHYTFEEVPLTGTKSVPCSVCGKKVRRQRTFSMTINPWNQNPDGTQRDRYQILAALRDKVAAWQTEPEKHGTCKVSA